MSKKKVTLPDLIKKAEKLFNKYIRERDLGLNCISCDRPIKPLQAGHYYAVKVSSMRFDELNVHGECAGCNGFDIDHLIGYRKGLVKRYGEDYVKVLDIKFDYYKKNGFKWERDYLQQIIDKYKC